MARPNSSDLFQTMHIECSNTATERLHDADCMPAGYVVEFSDDGIAQVRAEVGTELIEKYDSISEYETED